MNIYSPETPTIFSLPSAILGVGAPTNTSDAEAHASPRVHHLPAPARQRCPLLEMTHWETPKLPSQHIKQSTYMMKPGITSYDFRELRKILYPGGLCNGQSLHGPFDRQTYANIYVYMHSCIHTLHYITLHCIALHCIPLHYITLHYITLHCIYITLHTYM